jgi:Uma2 family endonuclease
MVASRHVTAEELLVLGDGDRRYELIDGELFELSPTSAGHLVVVNRIQAMINRSADAGLGFRSLAGDGGFIFSRDPDTVLAPDLVVFSDRKLALLSPDASGFGEIRPDIAIEVKSPGDREREIGRKLEKYLSAGVAEVWWVRIPQREITIHRPNHPTIIFTGLDSVVISPSLPGFELSISELFQFG